MKKPYVLSAILSIPLILAPITLVARSFIPASTSYVRPLASGPSVTLSGKNWAYTVPFPVKNGAAIQKLIQCESGGRNVSRPDSNHVVSWGILQFNGTSTWAEMERRFQFQGSPVIPADAIHMADMMIDAGFISRWTCARIAGLIHS
jgi:hypothetical protein